MDWLLISDAAGPEVAVALHPISKLIRKSRAIALTHSLQLLPITHAPTFEIINFEGLFTNSLILAIALSIKHLTTTKKSCW